MLRLAPSSPPLWRTPTRVQLGTAPTAVIDDIAPWQERMLDALVAGVPEAALPALAAALGGSPQDAARLLRTIGGALSLEATAQRTATVELPADLTDTDADTLLAGLHAAGVTRTAAAAAGGVVAAAGTAHAVDARAAVILVAHRLVDPRRTAQLLADDVPHLPIELSGDRASVGPLVVPGATACLSCRHAHRTDHDPQWPVLAAQLIARPPVGAEPALLLEAGLLAAVLLRPGATPAGMSVEISAGGLRRAWQVHRPHGRCLCRSPEGSASAGGPDSRRDAPTTT